MSKNGGGLTYLIMCPKWLLSERVRVEVLGVLGVVCGGEW